VGTIIADKWFDVVASAGGFFVFIGAREQKYNYICRQTKTAKDLSTIRQYFGAYLERACASFSAF